MGQVYAIAGRLKRTNVWAMAAAAALAAGCSSAPKVSEANLFKSAIFAPLPPAFIAGPVGILFTNTQGFSAHINATGASPNDDRPLSGELFGRGTRVLFAPQPKHAEDEKRPKDEIDPGFTFLWDIAENKGFLLCEALQAYAPVSPILRYTSVIREGATPAPNAPSERLLAGMADGTTYVASLWHSPETEQIPSRIVAGTNSIPMRVSLSRIRLQAPPVELFSVPTSFTKYSSSEALVDEMAARQRGFHLQEGILPADPNLSRPPAGAPGSFGPQQ